MSSKHHFGKLHVCGASRFIADEAPLHSMLYIHILKSPIAHGKLIKLDLDAVKNFAGVYGVLSAEDIPGENQIGHVIKDEPLFPTERIMYIGQPLAIVLAKDPLVAECAAAEARIEIEETPPILEIVQADEAKEWYVPERKIESGDVETALKLAEFTLSGEVDCGGQEHFYMETQRCRAIPAEGKTITIQSATQSTMEIQEIVSHVLGISANNIIIEVPRLGGAFGGKERNATIYACLTALAAYLYQKPVELVLTRDEDMLITGKRHPFKGRYRIGFDKSGRISAYDVELLANGGAYADLSVAILERALFHAENAYRIPHIRIRGRACRTNLPPNTAFRGFGAPQGIFVIEHALSLVSEFLGMDAMDIRSLNAYREGEQSPYSQPVWDATTPALLKRLSELSQYEALKTYVAEFNLNNDDKKQGIGITPVKFGISFTTALLNQGSALIWVYIDGTVSVTTGGIEMGQELCTKVAIVVSKVLGIPIDTIRIESANTQRVGNASPTAASTGSDINGNAARNAAEQIKANLIPPAIILLESKNGHKVNESDIVFDKGIVYHQEHPELWCTFTELVGFAYRERIPLSAIGYYRTPDIYFDRISGKGKPFNYYVFGAALSRVEIDLTTGEHRILDTFIVHENGISLSEEIDRGQIVGAFIQAYGWCTMEELLHDDKGRYKSVNPSTYKIPGIRDLPQNLVVDILSQTNKKSSVFGSKATGEPPFIYGLSVYFAILNALSSMRRKVRLGFPATPEAILHAALSRSE